MRYMSSVTYTNRNHSSWTVYIIAILLTILACAMAVVLRLFSITDLPFQTFAALIGVIITAIITGILLKGQSDAERIQKEKTEIFSEKLKTYNRFLDALCAYVTENTVSNKKKLIFHTMAIKMHANADVVKRFNAVVTKILMAAGNNDVAEVQELVNTLNEIATLFHKELYGFEPIDAELSTLENLARAIAGSQEEPSEQEKEAENQEDETEDNASCDKDVLSWEAKVKDLSSKGWSVSTEPDEIAIKSDKSPVIIKIYRKKSKYVVEATKEEDSNFSQNLKDNFKGSRRYGTWWRELPISNYGVTEGTLTAQLPNNSRARASVIKWIDKLVSFI